MVKQSRRKVGDAMAEWITRIEHSIKPSMAQNWRNYAAYYVTPYIGNRAVQDINGAVCDALYARLLAEGRSRPGHQPRNQPTGGTRAPDHARRADTGMPPLPLRRRALLPASTMPTTPHSDSRSRTRNDASRQHRPRATAR